MDEFVLFWMAFPENFFREVLIPTTNNNLPGDDLTLSEFYVWLGINMLIGCYSGILDWHDWWLMEQINDFRGAPLHTGKRMSYKRFDAIDAAIQFTDEDAPGFDDKFHEMRKMIKIFNDHYSINYSPSWIYCLDKSISPWMDKFCPGFICVPQKPHPFGNKYNTICNGNQGRDILWHAAIVEGKG